jgi:hypothetical protein
VNIVATTFCQAVYASESPVATGWPRGFLVRLTVPGSVQQAQAPGASFRFPGPYQPGDICGTLELKSAGGDSSQYNIQELAS